MGQGNILSNLQIDRGKREELCGLWCRLVPCSSVFHVFQGRRCRVSTQQVYGTRYLYYHLALSREVRALVAMQRTTGVNPLECIITAISLFDVLRGSKCDIRIRIFLNTVAAWMKECMELSNFFSHKKYIRRIDCKFASCF
jgi:hypothetical protein